MLVPLTAGGGITNTVCSALDAVSRYFRAGADKVSIGSDAVIPTQEHIASNGIKTRQMASLSNIYSSTECISSIYCNISRQHLL